MQFERLVSGVCRIALVVCCATQQSCDEPFDWCTEAREDDTVHADGTVLVSYQADPDSPRVLIELDPYVRQDDGATTVQGCGKHGSDLWRWRGTFQGLEPGTTGQTVAASGPGATYGGELRYCKGGSCEEGKIQNVVISRSDSSISGTVSTYQPTEAALKSTLEISDTVGEVVDIDIDLQWDAAP